MAEVLLQEARLGLLVLAAEAHEILVVMAQEVITRQTAMAALAGQILAVAAVVHLAAITPQVMAVPVLSSFDTHFNWRNKWHILQK